MKNGWRAQRGFTLIELMVVVAIVGVLASVSGMQWVRSQRRTQQGEAKVGLAALYAGQKNFYARYSAYNPADSRQVGFRPEGARRYQYWLCEDAVNTRTVTGLPGVPATYLEAANKPLPPWTGLVDCDWAAGKCGPYRCNTGPYDKNNPQAFSASSASQLCPTCRIDVWSIDQNKNLLNTSNGTR